MPGSGLPFRSLVTVNIDIDVKYLCSDKFSLRDYNARGNAKNTRFDF